MINDIARKSINVDTVNNIPVATVKELDDFILKLSLMKYNTPFDATGQTVSLGVKAPSGLYEQTTDITINKEQVDIKLKTGIVAKAGTCAMELKLVDATGSMTTASFFIVVNPKILSDGAVQASDQFDIFTKTAAKVEADYNSLKKVIIDENNAANLQDQINKSNSQLAEMAKDTTVSLNSKRDKFVKLNSDDLDISSNDKKIKIVNLSDEVIQSINGNAPVNNVIADNSVNDKKIASNSIKFTHFFNSFYRADVVYGGIDVDTKTKTITVLPNTRVCYNETSKVPTTTSIIYTNTATNIFYNLALNTIEAYSVGNFTNATVSYNNLFLIGTIWIDKLYNITTPSLWTLNGKSIDNTLTMFKNAIMTCSAVLDTESFSQIVKFDEVNKTIFIPNYSAVIVGDRNYKIDTDVTITIDKTTYPFASRTLLLFDCSTKTFSIYQITTSETIDVINKDTVILGSFFISWISQDLKIEHIQANFPYRIAKPITNSISSIWNGKKGNFIGDSITANSKYVENVKNMLGLEVARNYGIGGCSLCYRNNIHTEPYPDGKMIDEKYPPVISRYMDMDNDTDFIFILIGTNDYSSQVPIGMDDSVNNAEFKGGLNNLLQGLRDKYPTKAIFISTLLCRKPKSLSECPITKDVYSQAIRDIAKNNNIICCDLENLSGLDFNYDFTSNILATTNDGLHPNLTEGSDILGRVIGTFINSH